MAQGVRGFQYESDRSNSGLTALGGLPVYLDMVQQSGLGAAIRRDIQVAGPQGWLDLQMVLAVVFLNLAGGDCVEDLERLEQDDGFAAILRSVERDLLTRAERRSMPHRWRRERQRCGAVALGVVGMAGTPAFAGAGYSTIRRPQKRSPARRSFRR